MTRTRLGAVLERGRRAVLERLDRGGATDAGELVVVLEVAAGLCPRDGRLLLGRMVGQRILVRAGPGRLGPGLGFAHELQRVRGAAASIV